MDQAPTSDARALGSDAPRPPRPPSVLRPDPPRVPLGGRRRLRLGGPARPARRRRLLRQAGDGRRRRHARSSTRWPRSRRTLAGQGEERHLPVHVRRAEPRRHVRLQARSSTSSTARRSRSRRSAAAARRTRGGSSGRSGSSSSTASAASGSATCSRNLATLRRRHRVPPLDERRLADPRLGHAADEHGPDPLGQPVPGLVGELRPRQREREPARLRRHARPDRRADQRRRRTGRAATCRPPTRATILRADGDADPRPRRAPRA